MCCEQCKTAEPIEMPFGMLSEVHIGKLVLDAGLDPPCARAILGEKERLIVKYMV